MTGAGRGARLAAAAGIAAFAFLPIANWIPGGHAAPFYASVVAEWWSGGLLVVGIGALLALASRRIPALWRPGLWRRTLARAVPATPAGTAAVAVLATAAYAIVARAVFGGRPLLIDEIIQVWQGRLYAAGHLALPSTGHPELFGAMHVIDHGGRVFSQFPAGGPAMLALGTLAHAEWLVGPCFGGLAVWAWGATLRRLGEPAPVTAGAVLLLAAAPFAVFMSASHMDHVTTLAWLALGMAGLAGVTQSPRPRPGLAFLLGVAFGVAGTIRPVDALAFGGPAGVWLLLRALRDRAHWGACLSAAAGMALPLAALLWVNAETTGHPLLFGYTLLWGPGHGLGFHEVPWGVAHTPARGLELVNLYLLHLQSYFLEAPFPALLPALLVLAVGERFRAFDRYLAVSGALLLGLYWAYWHNGFYLGPRFVYPLLPLLTLWTARLAPLLRARWGEDGLPIRLWVFTAAAGAVIAAVVNVPLRALQYRQAYQTARWPAERAAAAAGARDALVLVRESWGAQVIARMWGRDVPRSDADFIYERTDLCLLDQAVGRLEREGVRGPAATAALRALTADSAAVVTGALGADRTEPYRPGTVYTEACRTRLREDARGFTLYPPLLLEDRTGNVYVRDLHAQDTVALARYPGRPIWLLAPADTSLGAPPRFHPVTRDSLSAAWRVAALPGGE